MALFDVDVVEPTCALDWGFKQAFILMLLLPFVVMFVYGSAYLFRARSMDQCFGGALSFFVDAQASLLGATGRFSVERKDSVRKARAAALALHRAH